MLLRAGRKMWYAGRGADLNLASQIADAGDSVCDRTTDFKPERDCALIVVMPYLTLMQYNRDVILDVEIERKSQTTAANPYPAITDRQAIAQALAITKLNKEARLLNDRNELRPDIQRFVNIQQIAYWCAAVDGMAQFSRGPTRGQDETRGQVRALLLGMDPAAVPVGLASQLSSAGLSVVDVNGAYKQLTERILKLANAGGVSATSVTDHQSTCNRLQP